MTSPHYSRDFIAWLMSLQLSRRAQSARDILLERGSVTTAELNALGYDHPPRIIGDLKDAGVSVMREMIIVDGRRMAKYWLVETVGQDEKIRRLVPKKLRNVVFDLYGHRCAICAGRFTARELQLDHRIPFRVGGDPADPTVDDYMPLCGSDNRAKSWSCEQCPNWVDREVGMCETCYWANPDSYEHIAGEQERRLIVAVRGKGVERFDRLQEIAASEGKTPGAWILENFHKFIH